MNTPIGQMNGQVVLDVIGTSLMAEVPADTDSIEITARDSHGVAIKVVTEEIGDQLAFEGDLRCVLGEWAANHPNGGNVSIDIVAIDLDKHQSLPAHREVTVTPRMVALLRSQKSKASKAACAA
jgi:hypothetical protein